MKYRIVKQTNRLDKTEYIIQYRMFWLWHPLYITRGSYCGDWQEPCVFSSLELAEECLHNLFKDSRNRVLSNIKTTEVVKEYYNAMEY